MTDKQKIKSNVTSRDIIGILWKEIRAHRGLFVLLFIGSIGIQLASLASPLYMKQFFNVLVSGVSPGAVHKLLILIVIIGAISAAGWVFRRMQTYGITHFESLAMTDLYVSAFDRLIGHSYQFFISHFSGTLTRRVAKYAGSFEVLIDSMMIDFFPMAIFVVGAVGILFLRSHILGIVLGVWVIVFVAFQIYAARLKQPLRIARTEADSKLVGVLSDDISNQSTIALFSGKVHEHHLFDEVVEHWHGATMRSWNTDEIIWAVQDVLIVGMNIGLLWVHSFCGRRGFLRSAISCSCRAIFWDFSISSRASTGICGDAMTRSPMLLR
jgi:ABC-type multidrug transport system fused ATPase/permease subunit